jgi:hypothetical protein
MENGGNFTRPLFRPRVAATGHDGMHWCLGMYASGSTWLFNVAMNIGAILMPEHPPVGRYITDMSELAPDEGAIGHVIVKTHDIDDTSAEALCRQSSSVLISIRDPRDCVSSLLLYQRYPLEAALKAVEASARCCAQFAGAPRALLLRYEDGFTEQPGTLDRIAATFAGHLSDAERARIFAANSRANVEARIATLGTLATAIHDRASGDIIDPATQWHRHHANRSGEVGRWRHLLTLADIAMIEQRFGDWMHRFGYAPEVAPHIRAAYSQPLRL